MAHIATNGIELHFQDSGQGEPLLLLHGFFGCSGDWRHLPGLGDGYRTIAVDLRGHGRSTNPGGTFTHRQCARDVAALLDHLGLERVQAVGISGGGNTLLHLTHAQPGRVGAMVLVSATSHFPPQARAIMASVTVEGHSEAEWREMRERHPGGDEQIRALWRQANAFQHSHDDMSFTPAELQTIAARTLLVTGDRDPLYPIEISVQMFRALPNASLWVVPGAGHTPVFGQASGRFVETARAFLAG
jgi:pimeloyl-ACP methyl ester carboxylesterase